MQILLGSGNTVKLGDKERFDTINLLLNKELLPIKKMPKLGVSEHDIVKISKKGDFFGSYIK